MPNSGDIQHEENLSGFSDEIINQPPGCFLRSGIITIALVFVVLLFLASFIKYPDKIEGTGMVTSELPALEIISSTRGNIDQIYFQNEDSIKRGEAIILINSNANYQDINAIDSILNQVESNASLPVPEKLDLGNLQSAYAKLVLTLKELVAKKNESLLSHQIEALQKESVNLNSLIASIAKQRVFIDKELSLYETDLARKRGLLEKEILSAREVEDAESKLLRHRQKIETLNSDVIGHKIRLDQLEIEQISLKNERGVELNSYKFKLAEQVSNLRTKVKQWKKDFIISAPTDGVFSLRGGINKNTLIQKNQAIGFIISGNKSNEKFIQALCPAAQIGKIDIDNKVIIKFIGYPHKEFGTVISKVGYISQIPINDEKNNLVYEVNIPLDVELKTTYNKTINYKPNSAVQVEIITEDRTVLDRLFNQLHDLVKN